MAISSLVVRSGVGSWGDIAHIITRGLDIGTFVDIWTKDSPVSPSWSVDAATSKTWTPDVILTPGWTNS